MATLADVRTALAARLTAAAVGANVYRYEVGRFEYPAVIVGFPDSWSYDVYGSARQVTIPLRCEVVASIDWETGNLSLETLIENVVTAIHADTSLGSVVDDCGINEVTGFGFRNVSENVSVLVAEVPVVVLA